ncbi:mobilization protein (plasmid) [Euhalothece natronophila Z-M001]|uniref:Mobilization protein n=1 Tax=Euhalothece natronophila Z-M001 TaxID=522448 RepID=A0A5B8NUJ8_9CHRO|nr:mobilization protein [Euhalothece natronophila]QDZ41700.1 mobilization protein [Euhalothece natronophila Z-M001]QDZ41715.1 mobilization protein [Euhalothece natronophila Z-M001]
MSGSYQKKIEKLEARKRQIQEQIRQEKRKASREEKKRQDRWKILVGAYCLSCLEQEGSVPTINGEEDLRKKMDEFLTRDSDRKLFGLEPLPKSDDSQSKKQD